MMLQLLTITKDCLGEVKLRIKMYFLFNSGGGMGEVCTHTHTHTSSPAQRQKITHPHTPTHPFLGLAVENLHAVQDLSSIPVSGRSSGRGNGNPLQYSCLENPKDRGAWQVIVHRVAKSWKGLRTHTVLYFMNISFFFIQICFLIKLRHKFINNLGINIKIFCFYIEAGVG